MVRIHVVEQDHSALGKKGPKIFKVSFNTLISMIAVDEDQVKPITIGADGLLHLRRLRVSLKETPLMTKHEMVKLCAHVAYVHRHLFARGKPRQQEEGRASRTNFQHVMRSKSADPISDVQELLVDLQELTVTNQKLLKTVVDQRFGV